MMYGAENERHHQAEQQMLQLQALHRLDVRDE